MVYHGITHESSRLFSRYTQKPLWQVGYYSVVYHEKVLHNYDTILYKYGKRMHHFYLYLILVVYILGRL